MDIRSILHKKIEEVQPGEEGGGEENREEDGKGETVAMVVGVFESGAEVKTEEQTTEALREGMPESDAVVENEEQTRKALVEGMPESGSEAVEEEADALVGVAPGAEGAVEEDAGALVGAAPGAGGAVEEDAGALVGVAPGAVEAEEDEVALAEEALGAMDVVVAPAEEALGAVVATGEKVDTLLEVAPRVEAAVEEGEDPVGVAPVVVAAGEKVDTLLEVAPRVEAAVEEAEDKVGVAPEVDDGPGVEPGRHGNRGSGSPIQTPGMHGESLLGLFGVCQHNEWSVENSGAPPAQQVLVRQRQQGRLELGLRGMSQGLEEQLSIEEGGREHQVAEVVLVEGGGGVCGWTLDCRGRMSFEGWQVSDVPQVGGVDGHRVEVGASSLEEQVTTERNGEYWVAELGFKEAGSLHASQEEGEEEKVAGSRVAVAGVGGPGVIRCLSWAWRREARGSGGRSQETLLMALSVDCITLFCFGSFCLYDP